MSTSTATAYKYSVAGHLSFGAPKCEKAQKSSGFWANRTYRLCIKDYVFIDPACGTAGFLVSASEYICRNYEDTMTSEQWQHFAGPTFTGFDADYTMLRISAMNLMLHSISNPEIDYKDSVSKQNQISDRFTMCLANPPFKGTIDAESIDYGGILPIGIINRVFRPALLTIKHGKIISMDTRTTIPSRYKTITKQILLLPTDDIIREIPSGAFFCFVNKMVDEFVKFFRCTKLLQLAVISFRDCTGNGCMDQFVIAHHM